jgi:hypothetical protein
MNYVVFGPEQTGANLVITVLEALGYTNLEPIEHGSSKTLPTDVDKCVIRSYAPTQPQPGWASVYCTRLDLVKSTLSSFVSDPSIDHTRPINVDILEGRLRGQLDYSKRMLDTWKQFDIHRAVAYDYVRHGGHIATALGLSRYDQNRSVNVTGDVANWREFYDFETIRDQLAAKYNTQLAEHDQLVRSIL